ncbi:MAG: 4Fe-4S dicluster domain-containing protein [Bacillota bacterium]|uniref:4Fe-4S dicluster domain-containing protein n=1 Tax=Desulfurispora thermophila TaxID=265470 RepID=UPI00036DD14C|nr:4Fe-4S dicluster domain-containing protein [Desulfurispora thermophila]
MSNYYLYHDSHKCISCHACEVQCKVNKGLPLGPRPNQVIAVGPMLVSGQPRANFVFISCFHCEQPWCVAACPNGAMRKREQDGIVYVDQNLCKGCKSCIMACPWSSPQWDARLGKVVKCDLCKDRLDKGEKPACVQACPVDCLQLVAVDHLPDIKRIRYARDCFPLERKLRWAGQ